MKQFQTLTLCVLAFLVGCQSTTSNKKEIPLEVSDILTRFQKLPKETQKKALENGWVYFTYAFDYASFHQRMIKEFPSLAAFGSQPALLGRTPLDLRFLNQATINPATLLLAMDLEMEILSRFHSSQHASPKCLEDFWTEWGLPLPRSQASSYLEPARAPTQSNIESTSDVPLNERSRRLSLYLKQSLGLAADAKLKLISYEDPIRAQFLVNENEVYEIFSAPIDCKSLIDKKFLVPSLGKMKCLQKQSAAWVTVPAKESTVVSDNWASEVKQRCYKWGRPLSDQVKKDNVNIKTSPLAKAWSLYPRLQNFVASEADRYEQSFRKAL